MDNKNLSPLQSVLLNMLAWFDKYCRTNELRYYAVGGTLLGAVRHHGFIPWDDDIDIAMPRSDYNRLAELLSEKTIDYYYFETAYSKDATFCYAYSKLYDTRTTLVENKRQVLRRGVFLDIFPFDGIGNNYDEGIKFFYRVKNKYNFYLTRIGGYRKGRSLYKNAAVFFSRLIPRFLVNDIKLREQLDQFCQTYDFDNSKWVGNLLGAWGKKEIVDRKVIGNPTEYNFEDIKIMGVENYDAYLTVIYGDWKKLPPKEKQVSHHDFIEFNLNKSYQS